MRRACALAGRSLQELAETHGVAMPADLRRHKGWVGQLLEHCLGASAASLPQPDFPHLGIELKTLPVDVTGRPLESTYVCTVPLEQTVGERWESCWVRRKLARVLWVPVQAEATVPLPARRVGTALLWSPNEEEERSLRTDWEELMEMICLGQLEQVNARLGEVLQIRPKAADAKALCRAIGPDGAPVLTNPRGFYLRPAFTGAILARHFG